LVWSKFGYIQSLTDLQGKAVAAGSGGDSALVQWPNANVAGAMNNRYTANGTLLFNFQPLQVRLEELSLGRKINPIGI